MTAAEVALDYAGLLDVLSFTDDEFVSVIYWIGDGAASTWVGPPSRAPAYAAGLPETANVFFGVNPTKGPARRNAGRGGDDDITRLAALPVDLDLKPGGCPSLDVAMAIVAELSIIVGTRPSALVHSGHGLHAYWPIDDGQIADGDIAAARALLKRWGRLVALVAGTHKVHADNVFDPARMMRLPGSHNNKAVDGAAPPLVTARTQPGGPLTMAEVTERLDEVGVPERDDDRTQDGGEEVSSPDDWTFAARTCGYVATMINGWATDRPKPGGGRNPFVYNQHIRLFCALRHGCITADDYQRGRQVLADLLTELVTTTEPVRAVKRFEIADMTKYAIAKVAAKTDERIRAELGGHVHAAGTKNPPGAVTVDLEWFWELTPTLRHVRDFAHARLMGPWAVLGVAMARVVAKIPPTVQLPPWAGGNASLNLFIALVGQSGEGKGGPEKTAKEAFRLGPVYTTGIGSGQGINHMFGHYDSKAKTTVMDRWSVYFSVPEVDTIGSERGRTGSNLLPQLRKAWDGSDLTFAYADRTKSIVIDEHTYRLVAVVGVQPGRAATLLDDVDAGTPQRYLWLPALATGTPMEDVEAPEPIDLSAITERWPEPQMDLAARLIAAQEGRETGVRVLKFPDAARDEIRTNRKRKVRGEATNPALDGHLGLCRMKAAAALALLHGEREVTEQFWDMSAALMAMSQATRSSVEAQLAEKGRTANRARGRAEGERAVVAEEVRDDAAIKRVAQGIMRWLGKQGDGTYAKVRKDGCASKNRDDYFDLALERLVDAGSVEVVGDEIKLAAK